MSASLHHKRHADWEPFDEVRITTVPRWKESEMSGDEWRISARIELFHKGLKVAESAGYRNVAAAARALGEFIASQQPFPRALIEREKVACDQPGCSLAAEHMATIREEFSARGEKLDASEYPPMRSFRKFCAKHKERGDCGREDSDSNYVTRMLP